MSSFQTKISAKIKQFQYFDLKKITMCMPWHFWWTLTTAVGCVMMGDDGNYPQGSGRATHLRKLRMKKSNYPVFKSGCAKIALWCSSYSLLLALSVGVQQVDLRATLRVFGSTTRVTRVIPTTWTSLPNTKKPAEVLSQLDNTSNSPVNGSTSVVSVAASGVLVAASGVVCVNSLFSLQIAVSTKLLTSDGARTKTNMSLINQVALVGQ